MRRQKDKNGKITRVWDYADNTDENGNAPNTEESTGLHVGDKTTMNLSGATSIGESPNNKDAGDNGTQKERPDLGFLGNKIRNFAGSDFSKDLFENYWLKKGTMYLSEKVFKNISEAAEKAGAKNIPGNPVIILGRTYIAKTVSFYKSEEFALAIGTATMLYDTKGAPVGFYDRYDFDMKSWGERSIKNEAKTRLVFDASILTNNGKDFDLYYGVGVHYLNLR